MKNLFNDGEINEFLGENFFLSNFFPCKIEFNGVIYPSLEHAFVAQKTYDKELRKKIAEIPTPGKAKRFGRTLDLRPDWNGMRILIMYDLLHEKFSDPVLKAKLLATRNKNLVEGNTWGDQFWGVCDGKGENWLGELLMRVRDEYDN